MQYRPTTVLIEPAALTANARALKGTLADGVRLMAVVKADGYGHGAVTAARAAITGGAEWLGVALPEEGEVLRRAGIDAPILVLGLVTPEGAQASARLGLAQTVCDLAGIRALSAAAKAQDSIATAHLKLDTGMGRLGVRDATEAAVLADAIRADKHLTLEGIYTHCACADGDTPAYTLTQQRRFEDMLSGIDTRGILIHAANSATALRFPAMRYDMVRCGIALYGAPPVDTALMLRPAMRWVTRAAYVKQIAIGESVSYGAIFTAVRPTRVMTLPVGYADGYPRRLGGRAQVLVRGQFAPVIGRVCMDQCMVDVTDIPDASADDEVVLLGAQGDHRITADQLAAWMGGISYEALLAPSARVPRRVME